MKIICVEFEGLNHFAGGSFKVDFYATDKIFKNGEMYKISRSVALQNTVGFIGLNATGKTTALRLLKIALKIVIYNADLNSLGINDMIADNTKMRVTFFHNETYYQLESVIGRTLVDGKIKFCYKEEILKSKRKAYVTAKSDVTNFSNIEGERRSELNIEAKKYLDDSKSLIGPITKNNDCFVEDNLIFNYVNIMSATGETPIQILELFDESVEKLSLDKISAEDMQWSLKFKGNDLIYKESNLIALNLLISTGTISGQGLILRAIDALKKGGYLIVDELESHLNKQLVKFILNLFRESKTNPRGACIIFSTHYIEILDFDILNRKDNIYISRKKDGLMSVSKFSDEFPRNDFKKSELIFSNALTGTAPKYETIQRLREFICRSLFA